MSAIFLNTLKYKYAEGANIAIYFLKRIPVIGKKIPDSLYSHSGAKQVIGIIAFILGILYDFVKKSAYVGLLCIIPCMFMVKKVGVHVNNADIQIFIFFMLTFIIGSFSRAITMQSDKDAFNMIILLRINPQKYYLSQIIYRAVSQVVFFLPVMTIVTGSIVKALLMLIELGAFRFIFEAFFLFVFDKRSILLSENESLIAGVWILGIAVAYGLPFLNINLNSNLYVFNPVFAVISIVFGLISLVYLFRYKKYKIVAKKHLTVQKVMEIETLREEAKSAEVANIKLEDMDSSRFKNKTGYDYLNSIFFARHKRIMKDAIKWRALIILAVGIVGIVAVILFPNMKKNIADTIIKSMPYFVFIMYVISVTERICKAMFFNCDKSLLKYGYYKQPGVILSNFSVRLKKILTLNLIPGAVISILLMIIYMICKGDIYAVKAILPNCLGIMFLSVFFSIHHLFMYYVLQPYTEKMDVKSPTFSVVNTVMYFFCYGCMQIKTSSIYFTFGVIVVTFIYVIAALAGVYKFAPKTFKLRK